MRKSGKYHLPSQAVVVHVSIFQALTSGIDSFIQKKKEELQDLKADSYTKHQPKKKSIRQAGADSNEESPEEEEEEQQAVEEAAGKWTPFFLALFIAHFNRLPTAGVLAGRSTQGWIFVGTVGDSGFFKTQRQFFQKSI